MRRDEAARRPSVLQRLFAERHIYLRSGPESRYVVVSSGLQAAVSVLFLLGLVVLGVALYSSVDRHLEAAEQSREVARLQGINKSLLAAAETEGSEEEPSAAAARLPELTARLEEAQAQQARAEQLTEAATAEAAELRRELDLALSRVDEAVTRVAALEAERDALMSQLNTQVAPAAGEATDDRPDRALQAEVADLTAERATLQAELARVREQGEQSLRAAEEEMRELRSEVDAAGGAREDQIDRLEVRIATLQAENERLSQAIDEVQSERHELETRLQEAETSAAGDGGAEPAEIERLREQLARAEQRVAELEAAEEQEPGEGDVERLRAELVAAEQRIAELQEQAADEGARPGLQRRPAVGDQILASDFEAGEATRDREVAAAPGYQSAAEAVAALRAELATASELIGQLAEAEQAGAPEESIADLRQQIENAGGRIQNLNDTLDRLRARDIALQQALATLAPVPPPPAPR